MLVDIFLEMLLNFFWFIGADLVVLELMSFLLEAFYEPLSAVIGLGGTGIAYGDNAIG